MIIMIDNFDSFTYNLVALAAEFENDIRVYRNNAVSVQEIDELKPDAIIISPGPCYPDKAGISESVVKELGGKYKILGVCLGHQAICEVHGAKIVHAKKLMHAKQSLISIDNKSPIFKGLPQNIKAARYHSLVACADTIGEELEIIGECGGEIMAVKVRGQDVYGLQFHPESILSEHGKQIMKNFIEL